MYALGNTFQCAFFLHAGHANNNSSAAAATRPDLVADSEPVGFMRNGKVHKLLIQPEDPHRRKYKLFLSFYFLFVTLLNLVLDIAFQVRIKTCTIFG